MDDDACALLRRDMGSMEEVRLRNKDSQVGSERTSAFHLKERSV